MSMDVLVAHSCELAREAWCDCGNSQKTRQDNRPFPDIRVFVTRWPRDRVSFVASCRVPAAVTS